MSVVANVRFFLRRRVIPHHTNIEDADFVSVTFEDQKNRKKMQTRTQRRTKDRILCPVRSLARVVKRVRQHSPGNDRLNLCSFKLANGKIQDIKSTSIADVIKAAGASLGEDVLGFDPMKHLGAYSLRCGAAMSLFVNGVGAPRIMMLGRWQSSSWLKCIREQVEEICSSLSVDMLRTDDFFHMSHAESDIQCQLDQANSLFPTTHKAFTMDKEFGGATFNPRGLIPDFNLTAC